jgi:hypothetical protein
MNCNTLRARFCRQDLPGHAIVMYNESDRCAHLMGASLEAIMYMYVCMYEKKVVSRIA